MRWHGCFIYQHESKVSQIKQEDIMSNNGKIFLGIVTAAAAGAVIGLLFAPDKGTDTRGKVKKQVNDIADEILKAIQKGKISLDDLKTQATSKAEDLKDKARSKFDELQSKAEDTADVAKKKVNEQLS
ncbi:gas vesicle protein [Siphonobacter sp. BAB-5404]|nr:gas vesicle protein [Siphonobacter sp. SORGH_AS_0500]